VKPNPVKASKTKVLLKAKQPDPTEPSSESIASVASNASKDSNASNASIASGPDQGRQKKPTKKVLGVRVSVDLAGTARRAWLTELTQSGSRAPQSFAAWVEAALAEKVKRSEKRLNGGQPFTPLESIPPGRH
jgi:hypothetical protein